MSSKSNFKVHLAASIGLLITLEDFMGQLSDDH